MYPVTGRPQSGFSPAIPTNPLVQNPRRETCGGFDNMRRYSTMKKANTQKNPITVSQYINAPERRDTYIYYRIDGCINGTDVSTHFVYYQNNKLNYAHTASFSRILDSYIKRVVRSRISIVEYNGVSLFSQHSPHPRIILSNAPKYRQQSLSRKSRRRNISAEYQAGRPHFMGRPAWYFLFWQSIIAAGITQRICQRTAAPPCGRNMEEGRRSRYYSGPKEHIPEHLQNGSQIAKKVIFFRIHTIHTKF